MLKSKPESSCKMKIFEIQRHIIIFKMFEYLENCFKSIQNSNYKKKKKKLYDLVLTNLRVFIIFFYINTNHELKKVSIFFQRIAECLFFANVVLFFDESRFYLENFLKLRYICMIIFNRYSLFCYFKVKLFLHLVFGRVSFF